MDGMCGGAILYEYFMSKYPADKIIMVPHNYGDRMDTIEEIPDDTEVYLVDYSLEIPDAKKLEARVDKYVWLDHHISAIKDAKEAGFDPEGIRTIDMSGCEIAWKYCYPDEQMPYIVHMLGRNDIWDLSFSPTSFEISYYLLTQTLTPGIENRSNWQQIFAITEDGDGPLEDSLNENLKYETIRDMGRFIYRFKLMEWAKECGSKSFEMELTTRQQSHNVLVSNGGKGGDYFHNANPDDYDILMTFEYDRKREIKYSVYTRHDHIDVSKLAEKFGGGGHKGASGFTCDKLPWELPGLRIKRRIPC